MPGMLPDTSPVPIRTLATSEVGIQVLLASDAQETPSTDGLVQPRVTVGAETWSETTTLEGVPDPLRQASRTSSISVVTEPPADRVPLPSVLLAPVKAVEVNPV